MASVLRSSPTPVNDISILKPTHALTAPPYAPRYPPAPQVTAIVQLREKSHLPTTPGPVAIIDIKRPAHQTPRAAPGTATYHAQQKALAESRLALLRAAAPQLTRKNALRSPEHRRANQGSPHAGQSSFDARDRALPAQRIQSVQKVERVQMVESKGRREQKEKDDSAYLALHGRRIDSDLNSYPEPDVEQEQEQEQEHEERGQKRTAAERAASSAPEQRSTSPPPEKSDGGKGQGTSNDANDADDEHSSSPSPSSPSHHPSHQHHHPSSQDTRPRAPKLRSYINPSYLQWYTRLVEKRKKRGNDVAAAGERKGEGQAEEVFWTEDAVGRWIEGVREGKVGELYDPFALGGDVGDEKQ